MKLNADPNIQKFNRYHHSSSFQKIQYNEAIADWFKSKVETNEWKLFACTVVFKPIDVHNSQSRYEDEYKNRFLRKIRRGLERSKLYQSKTIPYEDYYYFERYEKSRHRTSGKRCPFHIHSVIPIYTSQVHKFWSFDNNRLNERLYKDLHSIDIVQDALIEPIKDANAFPWVMYITKFKII